MKSLKMSVRRVPLHKKVSLLAVVLWSVAATEAAQNVNLAWDPSPDAGVASYRVHYGTTSGVYGQTTNAGASTVLTVQGLIEGSTYYFAVTAIGTNQLESEFSNEVVYQVPLPANSAPTITAIPSQSITEDGSTANLSFTVGDAETSAGSLTLSGSSANAGLVPNGNIVFGGSGANRTVKVTPAANIFGTTVITVTVSDGELTAQTGFTMTVASVNDAPTLDPLGDLAVAKDAGQQSVSLTGITSGAANENQTLTVVASSSNPSLIPSPTVSYASPASTGTLRFTPAAGQSGTVQLTVAVSDNGGTVNGGINRVQRTFVVDVIDSGNATPTLNDIGDLSVVQAEGESGLTIGAMGAGSTIWAVAPYGPAQTRTVNLTGITSGGDTGQALTVTASSSNPGLVPDPAVTYSSPSTIGSLAVSPVAGGIGSAVITVVVKDDGGGLDTIQKSFTVDVDPPANTPPAIGTIASQTLYEDVAFGPLGFSVSDSQTPANNLTIRVASRNSQVVSASGLTLGGTGSSRNLRILSQPNHSGKALINLSVTDAGGAVANKSFWATVNPVNDAPTLDAISDRQLSGEPIELVSLTGIGAGPLDGIQGLTVQANSSDPAIVAHPEVIYSTPNATAELQLLPGSGASGSAMITVTVRDDGGTSNGGQNTITRTFTVSGAQVIAAASLPAPTLAAGGAAALALPRPRLDIRAENGWVTLSWEQPPTSCILQRSAGPGLQGPWEAVELDPVPSGSHATVTLQAENAVEFFRLVQP